jgi:hypothetical protein
VSRGIGGLILNNCRFGLVLVGRGGVTLLGWAVLAAAPVEDGDCRYTNMWGSHVHGRPIVTLREQTRNWRGQLGRNAAGRVARIGSSMR